MCELEARIALLERALRELIARDHEVPVAPPEPVQSQSREPRELEGEVLDAIRSLDREGRLDGLVPIPWLRRRFPSSHKLQLDRALLELERGFRIDLKIANDPVAVEAPGDGILHPARGLLYYAVMR